ncbi:FkbM family methyltransferase, partial [Campylobacter devanensis]|uniref:FkbM family methyltransferase n=1 Tax=Campylobacter devanensis TaxID=3161138 RepID=UPI00112F5C60
GGGIQYMMYLPNKDTNYIQKKIYEELKPYELTMLKDIISRCKSNDIIVDVGSNVGNHTLFFAANNLFVYSFEANSILFDIMINSIKLNKFENITKCYNIAVSDSVSKAKFITFDETNLGGQSLEISNDGDIPTIPLDNVDFHGKVAVIKIDVEGMECNVLNGAKNLIAKDRPLLYVEAINLDSFKNISYILNDLNYVYWDTFNAMPTHLFLPKETICEKDILTNSLNHQIFESYRIKQSLNYSKRHQNDINKVIDLSTKSIKLLEYKIKTLENDFDKMKTNFIGMKARYQKELQDKNSVLTKNKTLNNSIEKLKTNFEGMEARNKKLLETISKKDDEIYRIKNMLSFRLGYTLIQSTKSFQGFIKLPFNIYNEYRKYKSYIKSTSKNINYITQNKIDLKNKKNIGHIDDIKKIKIAAIMDEFTYNSFKYECDLLQLSFDKWKNEIENFKPDLLFIESAWKGKNDSWATKISNCSTELVDLVKWCNTKNIPTMFWSKEDPVHFDTFLNVAKIVDYVFTTDVDCVSHYKNKVGHNRVYLLPFAAQPSIHNPIEKYQRKDKFNFAGSYYLRYPERQRDFASLIEAVKDFKQIEIYDRNFDNPHPHYTFPNKYKSMILGKLSFEEIDKAYKGYRFGINMNTIKQSQSMFARRVFELMASNTVVVSNFSKGVRNFFGDLVICSDNKDQIIKQISPYCQDEVLYKKLRLLGFRKIMTEHTYADRLSYICNKIFEYNKTDTKNKVIIFSMANSYDEFEYIYQSFYKQSYINKQLCIITKFNKQVKEDNVQIFEDKNKFIEYLVSLSDKQNIFIGCMNPQDYYGINYITDLILSTKYSNADAFGKGSYYKFESDNIILQNSDIEYKKIDILNCDSSIARLSVFSKNDLKNLIINNDKTIKLDNMLSIDSFNYCKNAKNVDYELLKQYIEDLNIVDTGVDVLNIANIISKDQFQEKRAIVNSSVRHIDGSTLFSYFDQNIFSNIKLTLSNGRLLIKSNLLSTQHKYIYLNKQFSREELNLVTNSHIEFIVKEKIQGASFVFEFQDLNGEKISHSMSKISNAVTLAIPNECKYIRIGFKMVAKSEVEIHKLLLGKVSYYPNSLIGKSRKLVLTKQYPSYDDIYKYGFLHTRVKAYKENGTLVDVFRISNEPDILYREFEGIDVSCGDSKFLEDILKSGQYDHVLVHLIDTNMWSVLEKFIDKIKVTIWVHGAEIDTWQKRAYEFEHMSQDEIARQKKLSDNRVKFWRNILSKNYPNLYLVFVSEYFKNESLEGISLSLNSDSYSIIHNYIDSKLFRYQKKNSNFRKKIFSVRPYHSRTYANDMAAEAIKILSKKDFFNDLEFCLVGDGKLFDEITEPLRQFSNVKLEKR